eukprot:scaffold5092_cov179-Amphora_coffeaeformis.AAC.6
MELSLLKIVLIPRLPKLSKLADLVGASYIWLMNARPYIIPGNRISANYSLRNKLVPQVSLGDSAGEVSLRKDGGASHVYVWGQSPTSVLETQIILRHFQTKALDHVRTSCIGQEMPV